MDSKVAKDAVISPCRLYRYELTRTWDPDLPPVVFVMMNPSTADWTLDDATIRKCMGFAKVWGHGGIRVVNLFAVRSRDPLDVFNHHLGIKCVACGQAWAHLGRDDCDFLFEPCYSCGSSLRNDVYSLPWDPIGPDNDQAIANAIAGASKVVVAWGCESTLRKKVPGKLISGRPAEVVDLVRKQRPDLDVLCFGKSAKGTPYHPLMLAYKKPLIPFEVAA